MQVRPLKICAGRHSFRPGGPVFEVADAEAKDLIAAGAVESVSSARRRRGNQKERADGPDTTDSPAEIAGSDG